MNKELQVKDNMVHVEVKDGKVQTFLYLSAHNDEESLHAIEELIEEDGCADIRLDFEIANIAKDVIGNYEFVSGYDKPTMDTKLRPMIDDLLKQLKEAEKLLAEVQFVSVQGE